MLSLYYMVLWVPLTRCNMASFRGFILEIFLQLQTLLESLHLCALPSYVPTSCHITIVLVRKPRPTLHSLKMMLRWENYSHLESFESKYKINHYGALETQHLSILDIIIYHDSLSFVLCLAMGPSMQVALIVFMLHLCSPHGTILGAFPDQTQQSLGKIEMVTHVTFLGVYLQWTLASTRAPLFWEIMFDKVSQLQGVLGWWHVSPFWAFKPKMKPKDLTLPGRIPHGPFEVGPN